MPKKKFSETKVGKFLIKAGSSIGEALPKSGYLGVLRGLITSDSKLTPSDKETALKLLDIDIAEMQEISKRWESDMKSDSYLSKNTRLNNTLQKVCGFEIIVYIWMFCLIQRKG